MHYDAIIIGGGPGGSTVATFLARAGKAVLVLERETFPRFHIGESLLPYNMPIFEEMGVASAIEAAGFLPKLGAEFALSNASKTNTVGFDRGSFTEHRQAIQVERAKFDHILLRHAGQCGAEVREGCGVTGYEIGPHGVTVATSQGEFSGRFLIDASGTHNFTGNRENLRETYAKHRKIAIFGHFDQVDLASEGRVGDTLIVRLENAWFWLIPLTPTRTSVGLVIDVERYKASGLSKEDLFAQMVRASDFLRDRMSAAQRVGPMRGQSDFSYRNRRFVSPRLIRVGDAAGFLDPIFSSGVYMAMVSGKEAAQVVQEALLRNQAFTPAMKRYEKRLIRYFDVYWQMIEGFYTHHFMEVLMQPQHRWHLPCAVNAVLAGRVKLPWAVRWRFGVVMLIGRLQRWLPVMPRLQFGG